DPNFNEPQKIDVLLGAEFYPHLLTSGQIQLGVDKPILQNSTLGWVVSGKLSETAKGDAVCCMFSEEEDSLNNLLVRFWDLEESAQNSKLLSDQEKLCETHFVENLKRTKEGRFIVKLSLIDSVSTLGSSSEIAQRRFFSLERRLSKNETLRAQYVQFITEYKDLGHMEEIQPDDIMASHYFIPHHCVIKPDSTTTKLRVVFDASSKTSSGRSLNDIMHTGPVVQSDLFSILLRFRIPRYAFTTDIEKMYRQILIHPEDQMLQLIIWRNNPQEPLRFYKLKAVTYGTRSAPYLATKCLQTLARESSGTNPFGAETLRRDFYVDDGLCGSNSLIEAKVIQEQLINILKSYGFKPRKWCANHPQLLQNISPHDQEVCWDISTCSFKTAKTLGMIWTPQLDNLCITTSITPCTTFTKRSVASDLARVYDPLGLVAPIIVTAKIFVQQIWELKTTWDDPLPHEYEAEWIKFRSRLQEINNMIIPRHVFNHEIPLDIQLHCFVDASEKAYGAAIYVRAILKTSTIIVRLLCSKSRVAPLKRQTIPRLELCAALLGAQLLAKVKQDLAYDNHKSFLWTDSQVVLYWINSNSNIFQTFVAHRVARIHEISNASQWRHGSSKLNPADHLSRGLQPTELHSSHIWFFGPLYLYGSESSWPGSIAQEHLITDHSETKRRALEMQRSTQPSIVTSAITSITEDFIYKINYRNSFARLQRIIAYALRFVKYSKGKDNRHTTSLILSPDELNSSLQVIIRIIQQSDFREELQQLHSNGTVHKTSSLSSLSPFLDSNGILRVGGRLSSSLIAYDTKHPMVLPYNDPIVKSVFVDVHRKNMHCGAQALLSQIRLQFWPIKGKIMARSTVQHCVRCTRSRPTTFQQIMGQLPPARVQPSRPFYNAGVDFCGPFWVHYKIRGKRPHKVYVAVFCCFATKAVHLEVVSDLTSDAFIGALKRLIARRGHCKTLHCDNATNFVGANNKLNELSELLRKTSVQNKIVQTCSDKLITFKFIPPRTPHFGGLWEAAVKSAKYHLVRSTSTASLTYEELETIIVEIE
ncbi:uncharacterized protein LOC119665293, partial [Teleopsis dalmanni]|uniref:uncharacterized protein LOC119665293 n=1 Tax=Teleopsis dalmanni TaxID=139649 RepID=UPI0018CC7E95